MTTTLPRTCDPFATPERRAVRGTVRLVQRFVAPYQQVWGNEGELPQTVSKRVAELVVLDLAFPEAFDGKRRRSGGHRGRRRGAASRRRSGRRVCRALRDRHRAAVPRGEPNLVREACFAKNTAVEAGAWAADQAVQLHGGLGYIRECEVDRQYRDMRILAIGGGTTEILTGLAATSLGYA